MKGSYVYFVQAVSGGPIKIGCSIEPMRRLRELSYDSEERLVLLAFAPGGRTEERLLHSYLSADRDRGEWFHPSREVVSMMRWVAEICAIPTHVLKSDSPRHVHRMPLLIGPAQSIADMA